MTHSLFPFNSVCLCLWFPVRCVDVSHSPVRKSIQATLLLLLPSAATEDAEKATPRSAAAFKRLSMRLSAATTAAASPSSSSATSFKLIDQFELALKESVNSSSQSGYTQTGEPLMCVTATAFAQLNKKSDCDTQLTHSQDYRPVDCHALEEVGRRRDNCLTDQDNCLMMVAVSWQSMASLLSLSLVSIFRLTISDCTLFIFK